jgi:membrane-bound metal-dependent hydrolase YbcI (DUF457 family)
MFIFGHVGITLGAATAVCWGITGLRSSPEIPPRADSKTLPVSKITGKPGSISERIGLGALSRFLDIRILMIGALMPDIIDKPLSFLGFGNGRSITHTLLVFLIVLALALYLWKNRRQTWLIAIAVGMFTHLIFDRMWSTPRTLFWPLYGWAFTPAVQKIGLGQFTLWWHELFANSYVYISETIGFLVFVFFVGILLREKKLQAFLLKGKI